MIPKFWISEQLLSTPVPKVSFLNIFIFLWSLVYFKLASNLLWILQPLPLESWDYRYVPLLLVCTVLGMEPTALCILGQPGTKRATVWCHPCGTWNPSPWRLGRARRWARCWSKNDNCSQKEEDAQWASCAVWWQVREDEVVWSASEWKGVEIVSFTERN